jgi:adenylosuccinate synthase
MTTPERSVEEIVEEFNGLHVVSIAIQSGMMAGKNSEEDCLNAYQRIEDWLTQTLQAERQKRDEMVEAEREFWEQIVANQKVEIEMLRVKPDKQIFITQPNNPK